MKALTVSERLDRAVVLIAEGCPPYTGAGTSWHERWYARQAAEVA